jgi:BioD-like phosphotransacetylase family protein
VVVLQVVGDRPGTGKTCLVGAILTHLAATGRSAAYFKPFSNDPQADADVAFVATHLLAGAGFPQAPAPVHTPQEDTASTLLTGAAGQEIGKAVADLASTADVVLVEGPDLTSPGGHMWPLPLELAELLNAKVLLLLSYGKNLDIQALLDAVQPLTDRFAGVAFNSVPAYRRHAVQEGLAAEVRSRGLSVLGTLPEDRPMLAVTVQQVADHLGGTWVQETVNTDAYVDRFLIGGNIMDSGITYFGRFPNQAVITRAERPDIQMSCLMTETRCLVLTGGGEPTEYVKAEAYERGVPLILVEATTLETAEALGGMLDLANPHSLGKIARFTELARQHLDLEALTSTIT